MLLSVDVGPDAFPYAPRRMPVLAQRAVVATGEPLSAQAGLEMLRTGGNSVDAALATAIAAGQTRVNGRRKIGHGGADRQTRTLRALREWQPR